MKVQTTSWINMDTYSSDPVQTDFRKPFWVWPWWTYQVKLGCVYGFLRPPRTCVDNCPPMSNGHLKPSDMKPFQHEVLQTWTPWTFTFKHGTHRTWRHSSLQTWSHQHDNPQKDAFKHEAIKHEALQTWSPSKMKTFKHEALQAWWNVFKTSNMKPLTRRPSEGCLQTWSHQTWSPSNMKPSDMKPFKHEALQIWWNFFKPSNMKPSTRQPSERCLQTWSYQTWSPSKMKTFKHDALQTIH